MLTAALSSTAAPALVVNGVTCDKTETVAGMTACLTQATLDGQPFRLNFSVAGASIDLDGDGIADLIMSLGANKDEAIPTAVSFFRGKGNGKDFVSYAPRILGNGGTVEAHFARHIAIGDFNEDGRPDFFVADATERHDANGIGYGAPQYLYVANGDGSFTKLDAGVGTKIVHGEAVGVPSRDGFALVLNTPWRVVEGSINYVNLVSVAGSGPATARKYLPDDPALQGNVAPYLTVIDANGDGVRDVVQLGRYSDNSNVILLNDGRGNLSPSRVLANWNTSSKKYQAEDAEVGDLNGDGLPDMLVLHIDHSQPGAKFSSLRVWINDGRGGFRDETATWLGTNLQDFSGGYYDFKIVDLDSDGFPDVVFQAAEPRYSSNRREFVLRNNAGRSFERLDFGILKMDDWTGGSIVVMAVNGLPTVMYSSNGLVYSLRFVSQRAELNQHGLTGSWYEAATGGQGVEVEVFANPSSGMGSAFVSWFTYDKVSGGTERQRWYTAQGPVATGQPTAALTVYQNTGGNFNAPPATTAQAVGTATLSFNTCTSGQLAYTFTDGTGRTGTISLTRLTQNVTCSTTSSYPTNADFALSGNWFGGAATSGQGFTVEVNPSSSALFAAWYTYMPNGTAAGAAGQRWYTAQAAFTPGLRSMPVMIYETTGGVRHPDACWPEDRVGGDRDDGLPELLGRDVQLQLHRRRQQWAVRNHQPEPRRTGAPGLHNVANRRACALNTH